MPCLHETHYLRLRRIRSKRRYIHVKQLGVWTRKSGADSQTDSTGFSSDAAQANLPEVTD